MTQYVNFSVPQVMPIGSINYNGFPTGILPASTFKRYWMGYSVASTATYPADFIDLAGDAFNFIQFKIKGYIGDTNLGQRVFTDKGLPKHPTFIWWFMVPLPIPINNRALLQLSNLRTTAGTKNLINFYIATEIHHVDA